MLKSMENDGFVKSELEPADSSPAKRRYTLTKSGRACMEEWKETLKEYSAAIAEILKAITMVR